MSLTSHAPPRVQIGDIRCHIVSDGKHRADGGGFFGLVPRVLWRHVIEPDADNMIPNAFRCLLVETPDDLILVDTGLGDKYTPSQRERFLLPLQEQRLLQDLRAAGFGPEQVTLVLLTHLHNDHAGGMTRWVGQGTERDTAAVFPNAVHIVQGQEYHDATNPNERTRATYLHHNWSCLVGTGQLKAVFGSHDFGPSVRSETAAGHTPSLQVVWVESGGESLLFLGDAVSWGVHLERLAWVPSFDILPMVSVETKRKLQTQILDKDPLLVLQHDAHFVTGRLRQSNSGRELRLEGEITEEPAWDRVTQTYI